MCTKKEVEDAISAGIGPLVTAMGYIKDDITDIKESIRNPPCQDHGEKITRLQVQFAALKESSEKYEGEKNKELYPRLRDTETAIATLIQQNKGKADWSSKTWAFIMVVITVAFNALSYYLR